MGSIEFGAEQAVKNCVRLQPDEKVVIITDNSAEHIAAQIRRFAEEISPGRVHSFLMEAFGDRPDDGSKPIEFPEVIGKELEDADVSFYCAAGKKGELQSFRIPMITKVEENKKLRHAHMPGINDQLMEMGMSVDYAAVQEMCRKVGDIVVGAERITVTNPAGTNFTAEFNTDWRWKVSDGQIGSKDWSNLPDGEIFTCVKNIAEGVIVVDGVLGDYFSHEFGLLAETPMTMQIKDSRVVSLECANEKLKKDFTEYMKMDENANRIGEFAIGTNIGLEKLVGNLLQDEKFPGIHVAVGHGYPEKTGSDWESKAHCDAVLKNTTIVVGDQMIMDEGKFLI